MPFLKIPFIKQKNTSTKKNLSLKLYFFRKTKLSLFLSEDQKKERAWKIIFFPDNISASLTIEASLGLTFFLLLMTGLCQLFLVMQLQIRMQKALEQVGNEAAQYSYLSSQAVLWNSKSSLIAEIEHMLLTELSEEALRLRFLEIAGEDYLDRSVLEGGADGISFDESSILKEHHRIRLVLSYRIRLPVSALGLGTFSVKQQCYRYAWLGDQKPAKRTEKQEQTVYVTKTGQVYHLTLSCTYLKLSVRAVALTQVENLRNSNGARYYACELCRPGSRETTVYITQEGTRYHGDRECGSIRRDITAIPISEVGDLRPCSRCGQK